MAAAAGADQGLEICAPANDNAPGQVVISGHKAAVERAVELAGEKGAKRCVMLPVSAPFHCELMRPAMEKLAPELASTGFVDLEVPVVSNVTAEAYQTADEARALLEQQVCAPVRWVSSMERLASEGVRLQLEIGPGKVLSGLAARIDKKLGRANVAKVDDVESAIAQVSEVLSA